MQTTSPATVDDYIAGFPATTQVLLKQVRDAVAKAAPNAEEAISYGLTAYKLHGPLVYFGGFKAHIGFYPTGTSLLQFDDELAPYKRSKGTVQFPLDKPLPLKLIEKIVKYRVKENEARAAASPRPSPRGKGAGRTKPSYARFLSWVINFVNAQEFSNRRNR